MTEISESRTREIQHWLDDRLAEPDLPYQAMALLRDAAALIRQLQAAEQAAWHAGLDEGRCQSRGNLIEKLVRMMDDERDITE